jgi:hypothetical protein
MGQYAFLYRELLFNIEHVEKANEGELPAPALVGSSPCWL